MRQEARVLKGPIAGDVSDEEVRRQHREQVAEAKRRAAEDANRMPEDDGWVGVDGYWYLDRWPYIDLAPDDGAGWPAPEPDGLSMPMDTFRRIAERIK